MRLIIGYYRYNIITYFPVKETHLVILRHAKTLITTASRPIQNLLVSLYSKTRPPPPAPHIRYNYTFSTHISHEPLFLAGWVSTAPSNSILPQPPPRVSRRGSSTPIRDSDNGGNVLFPSGYSCSDGRRCFHRDRRGRSITGFGWVGGTARRGRRALLGARKLGMP